MVKDKKYYIKKVVRFLNESRIYLSPDEVILLIDIYKNNKLHYKKNDLKYN